MRTVESMIRELQNFPPNAMCKSYEGEETGVVILNSIAGEEIGFVPASMHGVDESGVPAQISEQE